MGKTTTAYNIIKNYPVFKRVAEVDLIKTILRTVLNESKNGNTEFFEKYNFLLSSSTDISFLSLK
ncbi:MAG: hypothetical protein J1F32_02060, partial [Erysipelotrichales bacterium]|nr:hypothetical protein [Erysipelotrichales bacterium]